jgi:hypothetical protein
MRACDSEPGRSGRLRRLFADRVAIIIVAWFPISPSPEPVDTIIEQGRAFAVSRS